MKPLRLAELEPRFLRHVVAEGRETLRFVETIDEAQGIMFLCPLCFALNKGPAGTHSIICWSRSRGAPDSATPAPGRWTLAGSGYHDLTLNGDPPGAARSVLLKGGCGWHGYITNGEATTA